MSSDNSLLTQIQTEVQKTQEGIMYAQRERQKELQQQAEFREYEKAIYEVYVNRIKKERFFRYQHVLDLGIPHDILILLSAKNIGKTTEIFRLINRCVKEGKKFIYGRVTVGELNGSTTLFDDPKSPVVMAGSRGKCYFYMKTDVHDYQMRKLAAMEIDQSDIAYNAAPTHMELKKAGFRHVGLGTTFMNSNTLGGDNYEDYEYMFFDEIVSYNPKQYVNTKVLNNWGCAVSTVLRNKEKMTIIMFGNLQNDVDGIPILDEYDISMDDNLRIIKRGMGHKESANAKECTILYINAGGYYQNSISNQAAIAAHSNLNQRLFLKDNKLLKNSSLILSRELIEDFKPVFGIVFEISAFDDPYIFELCRHDERVGIDKGNHAGAVKVLALKLTSQKRCPLYSPQASISNKFDIVDHEPAIYDKFDLLYSLYKNRLLYYTDKTAMYIFCEFMEYYKQKYAYEFIPDQRRKYLEH